MDVTMYRKLGHIRKARTAKDKLARSSGLSAVISYVAPELQHTLSAVSVLVTLMVWTCPNTVYVLAGID